MYTTQTAMQAAAAQIALAAKLYIQLSGTTTHEALNIMARAYASDAHDARTRTKGWARETTSEMLEEVLFLGSVARDILDGTVSRPSTGNVRAYALAAIQN